MDLNFGSSYNGIGHRMMRVSTLDVQAVDDLFGARTVINFLNTTIPVKCSYQLQSTGGMYLRSTCFIFCALKVTACSEKLHSSSEM
jgi:hypothetical protein